MTIGATDSQDRRWSVGELARATGLSVRVLRHWDEIGLVSPPRTAGGHRYYTRAEVTRLYRALALRQMGLRLDQVTALLTDADPSPRATLRAHLEQVETELAERRTLRDRLVEVLQALDASTTTCDNASGVDSDADSVLLMKVIEKMTMFEQHLDPAQRDWFTRRREQVGEQAWQDALAAWPELITAVRAEMDAGTDPADPHVQELMARWNELQRVFLDDDAEVRTAAGRAWRAIWDHHPDQLRSSPRVAPPEMWDYIQRAQATNNPG